MTEKVTPLIIVVRDPDYSNEYHVFGSNEVETYDIDCGYADLDDDDEYTEWAESHLAGADQLEAKYPDAAQFIRNTVKEYEPADYEPPERGEE